ncbi:hypothetical protein GCM10027176_50290 [Actinoallomurus bryophytorum]|uniref:Uncharacterized protein n=1 Tax=Actinoallomurus bryophytorum TaxID=1490222 RepID=A0A543CIJ0_9ACTN|nr:hypothetical protein [Actinoallomurus bryophytorum]TQL96717.1 hypothetical protein FB559_2266 [Actinoallomurus bryophytorum]
MPGQRKPELNITQLIAGAGATVTATVAASYFGVGGTLIGAGAVSVLSTVGATIYQHFLDRGKQRIVAKIPARVGAGRGGEVADPVPTGTGGRPWPKWYVLCGAAAGIFLAVMGLVTAFELFTGKPLSNTVQGRKGHGTSVHPEIGRVRPAPGPQVSGEATPDVRATPSASATPVRTPRSTPTPALSGAPDLVPGPRPTPTAPTALPTRSALPQQPLPPEDAETPYER